MSWDDEKGRRTKSGEHTNPKRGVKKVDNSKGWTVASCHVRRPIPSRHAVRRKGKHRFMVTEVFLFTFPSRKKRDSIPKGRRANSRASFSGIDFPQTSFLSIRKQKKFNEYIPKSLVKLEKKPNEIIREWKVMVGGPKTLCEINFCSEQMTLGEIQFWKDVLRKNVALNSPWVASPPYLSSYFKRRSCCLAVFCDTLKKQRVAKSTGGQKFDAPRHQEKSGAISNARTFSEEIC